MAVKPISPKDVVSLKQKQIPDEVIEVFNELIAKHFNGCSATVMQTEAADMIFARINAAVEAGKSTIDHHVTREEVFNNHWMDVERIFMKHGWKVEYDKPGFNESYEASFTFSKKRGGREGY